MERTISLSGNGSMFTVGVNQTLVLGGNVTLQGHAGNTQALVHVDRGTFIMKPGAKITGNNNNSGNGGGVFVGGQGTFDMEGGILSGNASQGNGGGVYADSNANFTKSGGTVYGYTSGGNSNTAAGNGHAIYALTNYNGERIERFRQITVGAGPEGNLKFITGTGAPAIEGRWLDLVDVTIVLEGMDGWAPGNYSHNLEFSSLSEGYREINVNMIEAVILYGECNIAVTSYADGMFFAKGSANVYIDPEDDSPIYILMHKVGSAAIGITFTGLHTETVNLTGNSGNDIAWGQTLEVTVSGAYDSYMWFLDGNRLNETTSAVSIFIEGWSSTYYLGIHSLMAVVILDGIPYSKELIFKVVYGEED